MNGFFHGWRRKVGFACLFIACLFLAGWVRSASYVEGISFPAVIVRSTPTTLLSRRLIMSSSGMLAFVTENEESDEPLGEDEIDEIRREAKAEGLRLIQQPNHDDLQDLDKVGTIRGWRSIGCFSVESRHVEGAWTNMQFFPYWLIVISLGLVAAWLIMPTKAPGRSISPNAGVERR